MCWGYGPGDCAPVPSRARLLLRPRHPRGTPQLPRASLRVVGRRSGLAQGSWARLRCLSHTCEEGWDRVSRSRPVLVGLLARRAVLVVVGRV